MEAWKDIQGYEGLYQVSNLGRVRSLGNNGKKPRVMSQEITTWGYCRIRLIDMNHIGKHYAVHRLVANAFIGDCEGKEVNHLDEIKTNNRVENLQIVTSKENCNYGTRNARLSQANTAQRHLWTKAVLQFDKNGNQIAEYESITKAKEMTGIDDTHISHCCRGVRKTAGGYVWKYSERG